MIEYLHENKEVRKTVFACSFGAQINSFKQKYCRKSRDSVPLSLFMKFELWSKKNKYKYTEIFQSFSLNLTLYSRVERFLRNKIEHMSCPNGMGPQCHWAPISKFHFKMLLFHISSLNLAAQFYSHAMLVLLRTSNYQLAWLAK